MPYPDYTRKERIGFFVDSLLQLLPMIIEIGLMYIVVIGTILLGINDVIPGWLVSPIVLFAWAYANYMFWLYQAWRSSGRRGPIINPWGPRGSDVRTTVLWLSFGVFFHLYHVWLRSSFAMRRCRALNGMK